MKGILALFIIVCCFGLGKQVEGMKKKELPKKYSQKEVVTAASEGKDLKNIATQNNINTYIQDTKLGVNNTINALTAAAINGHLDTVQSIIETYKANINAVDNAGNTVLMLVVRAARENENDENLFKVFKYLLTKNPNLNIADNLGYTVVSDAVALPEEKIRYLEALLKHRPMPNINLKPQLFGKAPLEEAKEKNKAEFVRLLKTAQLTELVNAAWKGEEITQELVADNVDAYITMDKLEIPEDKQISIDPENTEINALSAAVIAGKLETVKILIETYKANVNSENNEQFTALMFAITAANLAEDDNAIFEVFKYLLSVENINLNIQNIEKSTVIHIIVELLLDENKGEKYLQAVLEHEPKPNLALTDHNSKTALEIAQDNENTKYIALFMQATLTPETKLNKLVEASWNGQDISALIDNNIDNYTKFKDENLNALSAAAIQGHLNIVKQLVEKGANINAQNNDGPTVLMLIIGEAAQADEGLNKKLFDVFKYLLSQNPDLSVKDSGLTVIHLAIALAEAQKEYLVELLKHANKTNLEIQSNGYTPLQLAEHYKKEMFKNLIDKRINDLTEPSSVTETASDELAKKLTSLKQKLSSLASKL